MVGLINSCKARLVHSSGDLIDRPPVSYQHVPIWESNGTGRGWQKRSNSFSLVPSVMGDEAVAAARSAIHQIGLDLVVGRDNITGKATGWYTPTTHTNVEVQQAGHKGRGWADRVKERKERCCVTGCSVWQVRRGAQMCAVGLGGRGGGRPLASAALDSDVDATQQRALVTTGRPVNKEPFLVRNLR